MKDHEFDALLHEALREYRDAEPVSGVEKSDTAATCRTARGLPNALAEVGCGGHICDRHGRLRLDRDKTSWRNARIAASSGTIRTGNARRAAHNSPAG